MNVIELTRQLGAAIQQDERYLAFAKAKECKGMPTAIIMKTTKGKGVSYMENQAGWHGKAPNDEEYEQAIKELDEQIAKIGEA